MFCNVWFFLMRVLKRKEERKEKCMQHRRVENALIRENDAERRDKLYDQTNSVKG